MSDLICEQLRELKDKMAKFRDILATPEESFVAHNTCEQAEITQNGECTPSKPEETSEVQIEQKEEEDCGGMEERPPCCRNCPICAKLAKSKCEEKAHHKSHTSKHHHHRHHHHHHHHEYSSDSESEDEKPKKSHKHKKDHPRKEKHQESTKSPCRCPECGSPLRKGSPIVRPQSPFRAHSPARVIVSPRAPSPLRYKRALRDAAIQSALARRQERLRQEKDAARLDELLKEQKKLRREQRKTRHAIERLSPSKEAEGDEELERAELERLRGIADDLVGYGSTIKSMCDSGFSPAASPRKQ